MLRLGKRPRLLLQTRLFLPPKWRQDQVLTNQSADWRAGRHWSPLGACGGRAAEERVKPRPFCLTRPHLHQSAPLPRLKEWSPSSCTAPPDPKARGAPCHTSPEQRAAQLSPCPPDPCTGRSTLRSGPPSLPATPGNAIHGGGGGGSNGGGGGGSSTAPI